jgi:ATP-dependent helicase/nuclease subunit B
LDHVDDALLLSPQPPAPTPPVKARPRSLSVTAVETWLRNPYGLYAKEILRLKKLDDLTDEPNAAARGSFIHAALADFAKQVGPRALTAADWSLLEGAGRKALAEVAHLPSVQAFWWPWFIAVARWWWQTESVTRPQRAPHVIEERGTYTWPEWPGGPFTLHAKADRIDTSPEGAVVIDYKTGAVPSKKDVQAGLAAQLSLEALLVLRGGFDINASQGISTEYWRLAGTATQCEVKPMPVLTEEAEAGLHRLVAAFNNIATPYMATPITAQRPRYDDYDHLARTAEWSIAEDEEGAA